jgi:glycosyltransferase involved in cell wall biosynthesis
MPIAYSIADVAVSSSVQPEAFGRIAVEAQAMCKPIIASNLGGSKETILDGKSGFLYKFDDPRELAKILNSLMELDKDTLNSIGNEGRKNVVKKFDVDKMCQTTFTEYKKLLNL